MHRGTEMIEEELAKLSKGELREYLELQEALAKKKKWNHWKKNPKDFIEECLKIYPKDTTLGLIPLKVNSAQILIINEFNRQMMGDSKSPKSDSSNGRGYVRMIISKYRQAGFSTISSALIFWRALFYGNTKAVIISLDRPTTESIFSMSQTFWEELPEGIKPELDKSNIREMGFQSNNSKYRVFTAGADNPGRGTTNNALLCDEAAFFQSGEKVLAGLFQSISLTKGSIIIINSTSNGAQGAYYDLWIKAEKKEGYFIPLFVPWFLQDEYRMEAPEGFERDTEEERLVEKYSLDNNQLFWRRIKISETSTQLFKQEYPFTAQESFIQSGRGVFDAEALSKYVPEDPESIREYSESNAIFDLDKEGALSVWKSPNMETKYIIGADVAQGVGGDYSCAVVMTSEREVVALYRNNRIDPSRFGQVLFYLGRWYNNCLLSCESNSIGIATLQQLHYMSYPNIYRQKKTANAQLDIINTLGFKTTVSTKAPIISNLQNMVKDFDINIPSLVILNELKDYVVHETLSGGTKMGAAVGKNDDTVMALAICCEAFRTDGNRLTLNRFSWSETNQSSYVQDTNWL